MELENRFNIQIPDEDQEKIQTVGDAINYVKSKTAS
jgi:acyl carrier protein